MSSAGLVEDIGKVGDGAANDLLLKPLNSLGDPDLPPGGFSVKLARISPVGLLRPLLCERLKVPENGVSFAFEGRELVDDKTVAENGIVEPGPAARRSGSKVNITFVLVDGVELGAVLEARRIEKEAQERATAARAEREKAAREQAEKTKWAEDRLKAQEKEKAEKEAEAKAQEAALEADRITVRCSPLGETAQIEVRTSKNATVIQLASQIAEQQSIRGGGLLRLTCNGNELAPGSTLRAANVEEGAEIQYYLEGE